MFVFTAETKLKLRGEIKQVAMVVWQEKVQSKSRVSFSKLLCPRQLQQSYIQLSIVPPCDSISVSPLSPLLSNHCFPHQKHHGGKKSQDLLEARFKSL